MGSPSREQSSGGGRGRGRGRGGDSPSRWYRGWVVLPWDSPSEVVRSGKLVLSGVVLPIGTLLSLWKGHGTRDTLLPPREQNHIRL